MNRKDLMAVTPGIYKGADVHASSRITGKTLCQADPTGWQWAGLSLDRVTCEECLRQMKLLLESAKE